MTRQVAQAAAHRKDGPAAEGPPDDAASGPADPPPARAVGGAVRDARSAPGGPPRPPGAAFGALALLAVLAVLYTSYFAALVLVPVIVAIFFNLLFSPLVKALRRVHVPRAISAAAFVALFPAIVLLGFALLAEPASRWLERAPQAMRELQQELIVVRKPLAEVQEVAKAVDDLANIESPDEGQVKLKGPGLLDRIAAGTPDVLFGLGIMVFVSFFLLASGDNFSRKLVGLGREFGERRRIVLILRRVRTDIARYLATVTVMNTLLGIATGLLAAWCGLPDPLFWGVLAGVLNFAPYAGPVVTIVGLGLAGVATFDDLGQTLFLVFSFSALTILEGQLVTPAVLGQRLAVSPVFVFLSVIVCGWMWGLVGALIAVPILVAAKVGCEFVPRLRPFAVMMTR